MRAAQDIAAFERRQLHGHRGTARRLFTTIHACLFAIKMPTAALMRADIESAETASSIELFSRQPPRLSARDTDAAHAYRWQNEL